MTDLQMQPGTPTAKQSGCQCPEKQPEQGYDVSKLCKLHRAF